MKDTIHNGSRLGSSILIVATLMAGCASAPVEQRSGGSLREQAQIEQRLKEVFDAAEKKDFQRLDSYHFYGPRFTKFSAASPNRQDTNVAREGEHKGLAAISELRMRADDLKIDVFGDAGVATFVLNSSYKAGGGVVESKERSTLVFVKDHGSWKITHEHFSPIKANP